MRNAHVWTERTETGEKREVRASKEAGVWRLQSKLASEEKWEYYKHPSLEDLEKLKDILNRKYQRRRAAFEDVQLVERMIHESQ